MKKILIIKRTTANIINTLDYIEANTKGSDALRSGKQSSMRIAVDLVKDGKADAAISAGNTGALLSISYIVLRILFALDLKPAVPNGNCSSIITLSS